MKLIITPWQQKIGVFEFEDNLMVEANIYDNQQKICIGDIYLGRVGKILPNMNACFVKVCENEEVFLPFDEMVTPLKSGDKTLVQIKKEAAKGKNALATTYLSLAGMYCVLSNEKHSVEVSSKLNAEDKKYWKATLNDYLLSEKLTDEEKQLLKQYCLILRTNVTRAGDAADVFSEWLDLSKKMNSILEKGKYLSLFSKIYIENKQYLNYVKNVQQYSIEEIVTDSKVIFDELNDMFNSSCEIKNKLRLYQDEYSLAKLYCIESKLENALDKKVWLKSGGFLVIEPTEALTVIDVNSGKYDKKGDSEVYYKKVNEEAAIEIARQIRLRNISGIIIVDFINMKLKENECELLNSLRNYVSKDKVKTCVMDITSLGLVEMTRAKVSKPLWEQIK